MSRIVPAELLGRAAEKVVRRLGPPDLGVVLGSGFSPLARRLGAGEPVPFAEIPGAPRGSAPGHSPAVAPARCAGRNVWVFPGRLHLYEGLDVRQVAFPVSLLGAAGGQAVLLTCAAGGLRAEQRPGEFRLVSDHLNLTGENPVRPPTSTGASIFLDLQDAYDPALRSAWRQAWSREGAALKEAVLAAVRGPCYETPAEVRMLRALGADLVSMSVVPETIEARLLGLKVAAVACVANTAAGVGRGGIAHEHVLEKVAGAVRDRGDLLVAGIKAMASGLGKR